MLTLTVSPRVDAAYHQRHWRQSTQTVGDPGALNCWESPHLEVVANRVSASAASMALHFSSLRERLHPDPRKNDAVAHTNRSNLLCERAKPSMEHSKSFKTTEMGLLRMLNNDLGGLLISAKCAFWN